MAVQFLFQYFQIWDNFSKSFFKIYSDVDAKKTVNEDNRMYYNTRKMDHKNQIHCGPSARRKKMENVKWILCFMIYKVFF